MITRKFETIYHPVIEEKSDLGVFSVGELGKEKGSAVQLKST